MYKQVSKGIKNPYNHFQHFVLTYVPSLVGIQKKRLALNELLSLFLSFC